MARVVFRPRVSRRVPSKTWFAELATAPGPQVIGVTGDNRFETLFGREWLLEWSAEDGMLRLYQESLTHPGEWEQVTSPLPPVFDSPLPATARRVTFCFDQSARPVVAYEDEGVVKVTRWDPSAGQYVQNVSFSGADPCLVMDATWAYDVPNSDVLIFYLSTDRTKVLCRVQREVYSVEHEMWDYEQVVILDRVSPVFLRYQLLVADATGAPLPEMLLSALYPYLAFDSLTAVAAGPSAGEYELVVLTYDLAEGIAVAAKGPTGGAYADPVISYELIGDALEAQATGPSGGAYAEAIINHELSGEGIDAEASGPTGGDYVLAVIETSLTDEGIAVTATGPTGGTYDLA